MERSAASENPVQSSPTRRPSPRALTAAVSIALLAGSAVAGGACVSPGKNHVQVSSSDTCIMCHRAEALSVKRPLHVGKLAADCAGCHEQDAWKPASSFDHADYFALHGAHLDARCEDCHSDGYDKTPKACFGCHADDYKSSPFPGHAQFAKTCSDCHSEDAWMPASIGDHDKFFPLSGQHVGLQCASCHTKGYEPGDTPTTCVGCHQSDYEGSPYPGHDTFPTTCNDCHTTKAWKPASGGKHPEGKFPIASGPHKVVECFECHDLSLGPMGAGNTDCVQCHTRSKTDGDHDEVRNYPKGAAPVNFCLDCHADGRN